MRYRYIAGALLTIWGFYRFGRDQTISEYFRWITDRFLAHHQVHDEYFMYREMSEDMLEEILRAYREEESIEALTMLKVLQALEWNDMKAGKLYDEMRGNHFR